jgi:ABC-type lipoprotein export system ATPase subunit
MEEAIVISKVAKKYVRGSETIHALRDIDISIRQGDFVAIVGPSGSGKTTLLNLLGCLDRPSRGTITINGLNVSDLPEGKMVKVRRENIGFIFQSFFLLPTLNVRENIALPLMFSRRKDVNGKIDEILNIIGLENRSTHLPHQLSGGEMQRVAIGRALINEPKIILADEPTGNLDSATAQKIFDLLESLHKQGLTLIVVTHNMELADLAHRVIKLKDGGIAG